MRSDLVAQNKFQLAYRILTLSSANSERELFAGLFEINFVSHSSGLDTSRESVCLLEAKRVGKK
jgi:hypothetical protein